MSERLKFERFLWFHARVKRLRYPNSKSLIEEFEVSERTAQRDIEFMRDRLLAPLAFDRRRNGYCYTDDTYEIPAHWIDEDNLLGLAMAARLASTIPDTTLKEDLCQLLGRMLPFSQKEGTSCIERLGDKVSVKNVAYGKVNEQMFRLVIRALFDDSALRITYRSPYSGVVTERTVQPLHLMHYMGNWHLFAWCTAKQAIRDFSLARLQAATPANVRVLLPNTLPPIKEYSRRHFGLIQGEHTCTVTLCFSPRVAARISEQVWHQKQHMEADVNGQLLLSFPASDFRELLSSILGYGSDVRVVGPSELRTLVGEEIKKMNTKYSRPDFV